MRVVRHTERTAWTGLLGALIGWLLIWAVVAGKNTKPLSGYGAALLFVIGAVFVVIGFLNIRSGKNSDEVFRFGSEGIQSPLSPLIPWSQIRSIHEDDQIFYVAHWLVTTWDGTVVMLVPLHTDLSPLEWWEAVESNRPDLLPDKWRRKLREHRRKLL